MSLYETRPFQEAAANSHLERETAKEQLKSKLKPYVESITSKSKGKMYVCPLCGSGTGKNKTGAFSLTEDSLGWKCFSCNESGDIFDLLGKVEGLPEYPQQYARACELFRPDFKRDEKDIQTRPVKKENNTGGKKQPDFTSFFLQANKNLDKTDYHRGIGRETLDRFNVGYIANWRHPKAPDAPASPRLIIPTSEESYLARDTRASVPDEQKPYTKSKVGETHIFNAEALRTATKPIFIVEGEIDALSIIDVGGEAIGLGSVSMVNRLLQKLKESKPAQPLVIALDDDAKGNEAQENLEAELEKLKILFCAFNPAKGYKDANEALQADRRAFRHAVECGETCMLEKYRDETNAGRLMNDFIEAAKEFAKSSAIPTGYPNLDALLDGGLYPGLYVIGAIPSLGKTTFALQMADHIAEHGRDVLIFSLEMSRHELMAKSLSRISKTKTARHYLSGEWIADNGKIEELKAAYDAIDIYREWADRVFIVEGGYELSVQELAAKTKEHIGITQNKPVVIVDYLQILAPLNEHYTDKQNVDRTVVELKRLSRDLKLPVIAVSSFNRDNYETKASMKAFKESGAIEYGADVMIGLQFKAVSDGNFDADDEKKKNPREIELLLIKNRHGQCGQAQFKYYPKINLFKE